MRSLYIHVPFCFHKCHYCDFYSFVDTRDRQPAFTARLIEELGALAPFAAGAPLRTVFVGGGTPSLLRPGLWRDLLGALERLFDLSEIRSGVGEFTVECNPETVTDEVAETLRAGGVNRASVGAQSFNPRHLKTLERWHDPENVGIALERLRRAGIERTSLDLIFAIPGQTVGEWEADLRTGLALGVDHLSAYNLTYEPNTAMTKRLQKGEFAPVDEDVEIDMLGALVEHTRAAGLERYEVSNFAKPGFECAHNLAYWRQEDWLAAGPSASGHLRGWRWKNAPRLGDYLEVSEGGLGPVTDVEEPDAARSLAEVLMTRLRLREGVPLAHITGTKVLRDNSICSNMLSNISSLCAAGLARTDGDVLTLTDEGLLRADGIAADLMALIPTGSDGA